MIPRIKLGYVHFSIWCMDVPFGLMEARWACKVRVDSILHPHTCLMGGNKIGTETIEPIPAITFKNSIRIEMVPALDVPIILGTSVLV